MKCILIINSLFELEDNINFLIDYYNNVLREYRLLYWDNSAQFIKYEDIKKYYVDYKTKRQKYDFTSLHLVNDLVIVFLRKDYEIVKYSIEESDVIYIFDGVLQEIESSSEYIKTYSSYKDVFETVNLIRVLQKKRKEVKKCVEKNEFMIASELYNQMAEVCNKLKLKTRATDYYAFAAIMSERTELWRKISYLWYSAYSPLENNLLEYQDYNTLSHNYPTISFEKWCSFSQEEKKARALQYAAYSEDNYNGPTDSYWIYEKAAKEYYKNGYYKKAVECLVSATNRYATAFHQVKSELIGFWKEIMEKEEVKKQKELLLISFSEIYKKLNLYESDDAKFFFVEAKKLEQDKMIKNKEILRYIVSKIWAFFTSYGTGVGKLVIITFLVVFIIFPVAYYCAIKDLHILDYIKISVNIFLGIEYIKPANLLFYITMIIEVIYSYMILVAISTHLIGKLLNDRK